MNGNVWEMIGYLRREKEKGEKLWEMVRGEVKLYEEKGCEYEVG